MTIGWGDLELVALIAAEGSTAGAARRLGLDQTTAARRLARLERDLGQRLFDRRERRLVPRPAVTAIVGELEAMAATARRAAARLDGERDRLVGRVVVTTVDLLASRVLAPALASFRAAHPEVRLELAVSDANASIAGGEADVAVRLARPREDDATTRRVGSLAFALYGPASADRPESLPFAGYGDRLGHLPESRRLAEIRGAAPVAFRADVAGALVEAVAAGHRAILPALVGDGDARLRRLPLAGGSLEREIWLLVAPERRRDPAVAATVDWLIATLGAQLGRV